MSNTNDGVSAIRLADELDAYHTRSCHKEAAAELRRLHAENEALRAALEQPGVEPDASEYKQALGSKNCMQVAVAYMLGAPLADVPDFERSGPDAWEAFYAFFADRGFTAEMFPPTVEIDGDYLASGDTDRGTSHMVVMRGGELLHDPHPSNAGLKSVQVVWLIARRAGLCAAPKPEQQALNIQPPNDAGETMCVVRWMAETPSGWVGSYDKAALEQLAGPQPDARTAAIQSCIDRLIFGGQPAAAQTLRHHFAKDLGEE